MIGRDNLARPGAPYGERSHAFLSKLNALVLDGLEHGYFEIVVSCETENRAQRRVLIKAGKSYRFAIPSDEIRPAP
jgi:hypothetical protein